MGRTILVFCILFFISILTAEKIRYIINEHPEVTYFNKKYVNSASLSSRRYGRGDPFYYVDFKFDYIYYFDNNLTVNFVFFEFLSNTYRRGFVEMHFRLCDLLKNDKFFGQTLKQGKFAQPCPFSPGLYELYNMTIPVTSIPKNFPFTKGRIYVNVTETNTNQLIGSGYLNMEIKEANLKRRKN